MNRRTQRWILGCLIIVSVIFTPLFGIWGPFDNGQTSTGTREYFLPAGYAFSIWAVNYLGMLLLGIWQALPAQATNPRARAAAPWLALTALCNPVWIILASNVALVPWTVPVLLIMEVTAWLAYLRLGIQANATLPQPERWLHLPFQIYVGWLSVATVANTAVALNVLGWDGFGLSPITWTLIMLVAATLVAGVVGWLVKQDNVYRAVFVWAFVGIVVEQRNTPSVALTAAIMTVVVLLAIVLTWRRNRPNGWRYGVASVG